MLNIFLLETILILIFFQELHTLSTRVLMSAAVKRMCFSEQTSAVPVSLHENVCFQQGGIGPVGNLGPQGIKGFQVNHMSSLVSLSAR